MSKKLSFTSVFFLIFASVANLKNIPAMANFGSSLIGYFLFATLFFLLPIALMSAFLSANYPNLRGIYDWVKMAFGSKAGFFAVWFQWANTLIWYPSMLIFIAITLLQSLVPDLANNKNCLLFVILSVFWALTFLNLKGLHVSTKLVTMFTWIGTFIPLGILIGYGLYNFFFANFITISVNDLFPVVDDFSGLSALIAIFASMLGVEITSSHINDIENSTKNFPKAMILSTVSVVLVMLLASLSVATVLSHNEISLTSGIYQAFFHIYSALDCFVLLPLTGVLIALSSVATMINWLLAPLKGLGFAAEDKMLPKFLTQINDRQIPSFLLIIQAVLISLITVSALYLNSAENFFWIATTLSTEIYLIMYLMLFAAGLKLSLAINEEKIQPQLLPHKSVAVIASMGFFGCLSVLVISLFPFSLFDGISYNKYITSIIIGNLLVFIIPLVFSLSQSTLVKRL